MNASELRIGNYVLDFTGGVAHVRGTTEHGVWLTEHGGPATHGVFSPIPLTLEWLEKFGFQRYGTYMGNPEYNRGIHANTIRNYDDRYYFIDNCDSWMNDRPVKYVHELQNLYFALTGEELTV